MGYLNGYDVIIDEVIDVVGQVDGVTKRRGRASTSVRDTLRWMMSARSAPLRSGMKSSMMSATLWIRASITWQEQTPSMWSMGPSILWCLPPELVTSGRTITIYSYLANGALMLAYLRRLGVEFEHVRDLTAERRFRETAKKLITIKTFGRWKACPSLTPDRRRRRRARRNVQSEQRGSPRR